MRNTLHILVQAMLAIIIWSQPAWAGPAIGAALMSGLKSFLINMIVSAITNKIFGKKKGQQGAGGREASLLVNKQSNNDFIPVVYGKRRLGGTRAFIDTSNGSGGSGTNTLNMCLALCEGQMGPVRQIYFNDTIVFDGTLNHEGTVDDSNDEATDYSGHFTIEYKDGRSTQTVSTLLQNSIGSSTWTNNHTLKGVAYLALKLPFDAEAYEGGVPTVTAVIDGKVIRDVANLSNTSSGANQNPADVIHDYLTNDIYGKGLADSDINIASFQSAKTYLADSSRPKANGVLSTEDTIIDNIEKLLSGCNGMLVYHNGEYKLKIKGNEGSATRTFTTENILTDVTVSLTDIKNRLNKITINFANGNSDTNFNDDVVIRENATYKTEDANRTLEATIDMPMLTNEAMVETMGDFIMDATRDAMIIEFEAAHTEFGVEAGEVIKVTLDDYGFSNKLFRVLQTELTPENTISIVAQEYTQSIHI